MAFHFRGTALGGWLVLEPWITPSLFYQFLGASEKFGDEAPNKVGLDSYTFCTALGKEEANKQLRRHWKTWVDETQIANLKRLGVDTLRIPVGDWMYVPYEPYIGCMDGAIDELDRALDLCRKYDIKVIIDVHAMIDSQNGLDNSGTTGNMKWVSTLSTGGAARYMHWEIRSGDWIGHFNHTTGSYDRINHDNIEHSKQVIRNIMDRHSKDPIIVGLEPINEPWWMVPLDILQSFYKFSNEQVQAQAPHWVTLLHDSFRIYHGSWDEFMQTCTKCALDTHLYTAWAWADWPEWFMEHSCGEGEGVRALEDRGIPVVVGEWSLATDNCAMWLNGFNDNVPGYPVVQCARIPCPPPYMGKDQPGAPPDPTLGAQDPFGTGGESYVINGTCPVDRPFPNDDQVMRKLGYVKMHSYDRHTHGQFFWNFRTELEPRWDYQEAVKRGWLPGHVDDKAITEMHEACRDPWYIPQGPLPLPHYLEAISADTYSITDADASVDVMQSSSSYSNVYIHPSSDSSKGIISSHVVALLACLLAAVALFILRRYRNMIKSSVFRKSELYQDLSGVEEANSYGFGQTQSTLKFYQPSRTDINGIPNKILSI